MKKKTLSKRNILRLVKRLIDSIFTEYDNCWFEIRTIDVRIITRDKEDFLRKSETLSKLQEITMYKIEKSNSGIKKSRLHLIK